MLIHLEILNLISNMEFTKKIKLTLFSIVFFNYIFLFFKEKNFNLI